MNEKLDETMNKVDKDYKSIMFDVKYDKEQFKDPETIGLLMYRLARERENTNTLFENILEKLDAMKKSLETSQKTAAAQMQTAAATPIPIPPTPPEEEEILAEVDEHILTFINKHGKVDAEEIQHHFKYKGKNAASARLNALYRRKVLKKGRAGKKVLYWV